MQQKLRLEVEVTEEDLKEGVRQSKTCCPVALALSRVLPPGNSGLSVMRHRVQFSPSTPGILGHLDVIPKLREFIDNFDRGHGEELAKLSPSERTFEMRGWTV